MPLDLPLFRGGEAKGMETFSYETNVGQAGTKALGNVGFLYEIQQQSSVADAGQIKGLIDDGFSKDIAAKPVVEVNLKRFDRQVRQLWQPGCPWPVYADNGCTTAKLIRVGKAATSKP